MLESNYLKWNQNCAQIHTLNVISFLFGRKRFQSNIEDVWVLIGFNIVWISIFIFFFENLFHLTSSAAHLSLVLILAVL